jgi:hypothetical protein
MLRMQTLTKYVSIFIKFNKEWVKKRCRNPGSNQGPLDLQSNALPTELFRLRASSSLKFSFVNLNYIKVEYEKKKRIQGTTGFEPVTSRSAVECSTTELYPLVGLRNIQHFCKT